MSKQQIYARLGASDVLRTIEEFQADNDARDKFQPEDVEFYLIGYEFEDGTECTEDGKPL